MTPNPNAVRSAAPAGSPAAPTAPRLQLDPDKPDPYLDGAWWPRSTDLPDELPPLLEALSAQLGPIALIGYHRDAWDPVPGHLEV